MRNPFKILIPGLLAVVLLSSLVGGQTHPFFDLAAPKTSVASHPVAKSGDATAAKSGDATAAKSGDALNTQHQAHEKAECAAMMVKKSEMQSKLDVMDKNLDRLAAQMNTFSGYRDVGSNEEPMVAVINELIAQQKSFHALVSEMHPAMMASSMHPRNEDGSKSAMDCSRWMVR